jgi:aspartate aminotransferase
MTGANIASSRGLAPNAGQRSGIREVMDLAATVKDVIHLEVGEPDFPTPPHVVEAVQRRIAEGAVKYTHARGTAELRARLATKVGEDNRIAASPDEIVVTAGGTSAVLETLLAVVRPGDRVLIPDLAWPAFEMATTLAGGRAIRYPLVAEEGYEPDLDGLAALAPGARVLIVNSPANPTGAVYRADTVRRLVELANRYDLTVISDEVYENIVFDGEHVSAGRFDSEGRVITVFSFSKGYAMTGWRVGYIVAPRSMVETIVRVQEAVLACPSAVAQWAAEAALDGPSDAVSAMRETYRSRRTAVSRVLTSAGLLRSEPHGAFYALVDASGLGADSYDTARRLVLEQKVGVAPGEVFGPAGAGLVRVSLATATEPLLEGIARIVGAAAEAEHHHREDG